MVIGVGDCYMRPRRVRCRVEAPISIPPMRTEGQVARARSVLLSGGGIFWEDKWKDIIWFWDGELGWHLSRRSPKVLTKDNWSQFRPELMDHCHYNIYRRIPSPFVGK